MPGVAVLPPPSSRNLAGFGPDAHNGTYLPRQSNSFVDSPTMHNGYSSFESVLEIKEHAKSLAELTSKGVGAKALIGSAHSQIQLAQSKDAAGDLKAALHAFYVAATLISKSIDADRIKGSASKNEVALFVQGNSASLDRIKSLEAELEKSTKAIKVGTLLADRMKMLNQNGLVDATAKRYSREHPTAITPSTSLPDTTRPNRPTSLSAAPVFSTASSTSSSATTSPHAVVPPSSLGPPSPTSSDSSSPRLSFFSPSISEFEHNFPSIDELNEMESNDFRLTSVPRVQSAETKLESTSAFQSKSTSRFWTPPTINGALSSTHIPPERRFLNDSLMLSVNLSDPETFDTPASVSHRSVLTHSPPSIPYSQSHSDTTSRTTPVISHSVVNGYAGTSSPIQYPIVSNTSTSSALRAAGVSVVSQPPALPPQASINLSPLVRRRSDYMDPGTSTGSFSPRRPIDYPDLTNSHVLRPPPPVASSSFQRQHSHSQSYSVGTLKEPPKPPTIASAYPVTYWSDMHVTVGLKNLGNTCYMNATIQCLSATVPFARFFTDGRWKNAVNGVNPMGTKGQLASAFANILYGMSHSELPHLNPTPFRKSICTHAPQFSGSDQHDSQEFLTFLLDGLHEDLNRVLHKPANGTTPEREVELERLPQSTASSQEWEIYRMRNDSLIVDFFQGQFRNRLECLTCHKTSTTYNSFMYLSLPMPSINGPSKVSLQSCLDAFVQEEVLAGSEAWHCPHCKNLRKATKRLSLSRLPPILLIHLKRFSHKGVFTDKIETVVDFPLKGLDLTNYMPPPPLPGVPANDDPRVQMPPFKYDLYGVTNHFGSLGNGHYTAFIASRGGWLYCDDSRVTETDSKEVVGRPAYVLYYKRMKP